MSFLAEPARISWHSGLIDQVTPHSQVGLPALPEVGGIASSCARTPLFSHGTSWLRHAGLRPGRRYDFRQVDGAALFTALSMASLLRDEKAAPMQEPYGYGQACSYQLCLPGLGAPTAPGAAGNPLRLSLIEQLLNSR
jgi:hypothetical protein